MVSIFQIAFAILALAYAANYWRCFRRSLAEAKKSGLPYIVLPLYTFNMFWLVTHKLWMPLLEKLPVSWTTPWLQYLHPDWIWEKKFNAFKEMGSDMFLLCSPGHNSLHVANADAISQIVTRRNDFPKPIEIYGSVDLYGKNVVSTEGQVWRHHRKITSPPFTESNNHLVWLESLHQGNAMLTSWIGNEHVTATGSVNDVAAGTMRLSLHVISRAGFGVRLLWPHEELAEKGQAGRIPEGHNMTYKDALSTLLENILPVMLLPKWFLSRSPIKANQIAYESFVEWGKYMREMFEAKKAEVMAGKTQEGMDLIGALVNGAGITADPLDEQRQKGGVPPTSSKQLLSDSEILGNAFVFILAGHETAANTLHFSMLYLAMNWASQARLHKDLDEIFGDRPVSQWDYERDVPKLFGSMAGAVMNEQLRLIPPVVGIPKSTPKDSPQPLTVGGRRFIVPQNAHITLNTPATHRNPKYWPTTCPPTASDAEKEKDLDSFKPERWLLDATKPSISHLNPDGESAAFPHHSSSSHSEKRTGTETETETGDAEDVGGPSGRDTSPSLFHPQRGAYIPFSEGARSCLGRRFAQIEVLAVLAVIFRDYSVELAPPSHSDEQIAAMDADEKRRVWHAEKERAEGLLSWGMMTIITIQMRKGKVPLRFVRRGEERFRYD